MALELAEEHSDNCKVLIKVIGIGGGGCNAVRQMMDFDMSGVELIVANTDRQVLQKNPIRKKIQLGEETTKGLGAGSKPEVGRQAAEEDKERIQEMLAGADVIFIAAGLGGGTGTGAAPVFADIAREMGILTVAIVTKPFFFEGPQRMKKAEAGLKILKKSVDCLIVIPNDRISAVMGATATLLESFHAVDDVLKNGVLSIARVIYEEGLINTDLNDVKTIMSERGIALIGTGEAEGENRAEAATNMAISSPLLENIDIGGARGLLVNVMCDQSIKQEEYKRVGEILYQMLENENANVIMGLMINEETKGAMRVTVLATGITDEDAVASEDENELMTASSGDDGYMNLDIPAFLRTRVK